MTRLAKALTPLLFPLLLLPTGCSSARTWLGLRPAERTAGKAASQGYRASVKTLFESGQAGAGHGLGPSSYVRARVELHLDLKEGSALSLVLEDSGVRLAADHDFHELVTRDYQLAFSPEHDRLAVSQDGGANWWTVHWTSAGELLFCQHLTLPGPVGSEFWAASRSSSDLALHILDDVAAAHPPREGRTVAHPPALPADPLASESALAALHALRHPDDPRLQAARLEAVVAIAAAGNHPLDGADPYAPFWRDLDRLVEKHPDLGLRLLERWDGERLGALVVATLAYANSSQPRVQQSLAGWARDELKALGGAATLLKNPDSQLLWRWAVVSWGLASLARAQDELALDALALFSELASAEPRQPPLAARAIQAYAVVGLATSPAARPLLERMAISSPPPRPVRWPEQFVDPLEDCRTTDPPNSTVHWIAPPGHWAQAALSRLATP